MTMADNRKMTFPDLEPLVCDADNMVDVLLDMCETHFAKHGDANITISASEANRVFFIACQAGMLVDKMKKSYFEVWDNERGEGGAEGVLQLGALIAAHTAALADYDATPGEDTKSAAFRRASAAVTKTRQALFDHRPVNLSEATRKGEFMASCRTFIEWDDFDQVHLINALTPGGGGQGL